MINLPGEGNAMIDCYQDNIVNCPRCDGDGIIDVYMTWGEFKNWASENLPTICEMWQAKHSWDKYHEVTQTCPGCSGRGWV